MSCLSEFKIHISPMRTCIIVGDYSGLTKFRFRLPDSLFNSPNFEVHTFFLGGGCTRWWLTIEKLQAKDYLGWMFTISVFMSLFTIKRSFFVAFQLKHLATVLMTSFKFNFKGVYFARRQNTVETLHFVMV